MSFLAKLREAIWVWVLRSHPAYKVLKKRHVLARWVLYPIDTLYWHTERQRYDVQRNSWTIHCRAYSDRTFYILSRLPDGARLVLRTDGEFIRFDVLEEAESDAV